jgi:hypothetical protein
MCSQNTILECPNIKLWKSLHCFLHWHMQTYIDTVKLIVAFLQLFILNVPKECKLHVMDCSTIDLSSLYRVHGLNAWWEEGSFTYLWLGCSV